MRRWAPDADGPIHTELLYQKTQLQEHIYHRLQLWNLTWLTTSSYHLMAFGVSGEVPESDKDMELQLFSVGNIAGETMEQFHSSYLLKNVHNRWIVITAYPDLEEMMEAIRHNVRKYQRHELHFGVSGTMFSFQALFDAYEQSNQALRWAAANRKPELYYQEMEDGLPERTTADVNERCAAALISGDRDGMVRAVRDKVESIVRLTQLIHRKQLAQNCLDWIMDIQTLVNEKSGIYLDQISLSLWERLECYESIDSVKHELCAYFQDLSDKVTSQISGTGNAIIEQAKVMIGEEFDKDITLQGIADKLAIHPVWLSHLFKKETGQTFSDYVIELRIEKARRLLRESNLKIYEIASKIGYLDLQHFGKIFKKRTGMSPKEYRYGK